MSAIKPLARQRGTTAIEVAIMSLIFFTLVFATMELARSIYIFNTLQEVTRRAAAELAMRAPGDPDSPDIEEVRRRAIFQSGSGDKLFFAAPVDLRHVRVDYLALVRESAGGLTMTQASPLPPCAATNRRICMANPNDPGCVRFVRVRICQPGASSECTRARYQTAFPLFDLDINLPRSTTIATVETLGYAPNAEAVCL